jgi:hypothetical protein
LSTHFSTRIYWYLFVFSLHFSVGEQDGPK